jgi:hypothetical protein
MAERSYVDDPSVQDGDDLWRRVPHTPQHIVWDGNRGCHRVSSAAFDDDDGEPMSVVLAAEAGDPGVMLRGHEGYGVVAVQVAVARSRQQIIVRDPLPEQPAHALVVGRKTDSVRRTLARAARWVVRPPGFDALGLP